jgi:hypothetical protein
MLKSAFVLENKALKAARGATQKSSDFVTMALIQEIHLERVFVCFRQS